MKSAALPSHLPPPAAAAGRGEGEENGTSSRHVKVSIEKEIAR
jgi:hypothetical protein